jgi:hypothetical protein
MNAALEPPHHAFEDYPRRELTSGVTRRQLLGAIFTEIQLSGRQKEETPAARIKDLGCLTDGELEQFIPRILPGTAITIKDNAVWGQPPGFTHPVRLFAMGALELFVYNLMNGENTLEQIAYQMAVHLDWPSQRAFAFARGFFLTLLDLGAAAPKNPPPD